MATLDELLAEFVPPLRIWKRHPGSIQTDSPFLEALEGLFGQQGQELIGREASPRHINTIEFRWLYSLRFNAVAASKGSLGFIGINLGTFYAIHDLFNVLLSHPRLLPGVGNQESEEPSNEKLELGMSARQLQQAFLTEEAAESPSELVIPRAAPRDPTRAWYSRLLSGLALDFVYYHELTHLIAGHTTYRRSHLGLAERMFAIEDPEHLPPDVVATARALELDADLFAARLLVVRLVEGKGLAVDHAEIPPGPESLHAAALAMVFLFNLSGRTSRRWSSQKNSPHPHPFERILLLLPEIRRVLSESGLGSVAGWETGYRSALLELKRACDVTGFGQEFFAQVPSEGPGMFATLEQSFAQHSRVLSELHDLGLDMRMS